MNKLPEKIYATPNFDRRWQTKAIDDESVEYVRKDTFIEKACDWLEQTLEPYIPYCNIDTDLVIEKFKKYMEE